MVGFVYILCTNVKSVYVHLMHPKMSSLFTCPNVIPNLRLFEHKKWILWSFLSVNIKKDQSRSKCYYNLSVDYFWVFITSKNIAANPSLYQWLSGMEYSF